MKKIKVLIVDDSQLIQQILTEILNTTSDLEVVGVASDPFEARDMIKRLNPDVVTLDIEMPKMDGISFLRNIMRLRPMPVVMISTLTENGAPATLDALAIGAVDFMAKPQGSSWQDLKGYSTLIQDKVRNAARANVTANDDFVVEDSSETAAASHRFKLGKVICIGSSTGGTEALKDVLKGMPKNCPPILMTQHIPPAFSDAFSQRLDNLCQISVCQAKAGMPLELGHAYLAPGDRHLKIVRGASGLQCALFDGDKVNGHIPAVDVLFDSAAALIGKNAVAALLTGMGSDGAKGMKAIHDAGGKTIAQDERSSVVWGMPGAAVKIGAAQRILPLKRILEALLQDCSMPD